MREAQIVEQLASACGTPELIFQITQQREKFSIVINHPAGVQLEYETLITAIETVITTQINPDCAGFWLSSRVLGQVEVGWQTYISLEPEAKQPPAKPSEVSTPTQTPDKHATEPLENPASAPQSQPVSQTAPATAASKQAPDLDIKTAPVIVGDRRHERPAATPAQQKFAAAKTFMLPEENATSAVPPPPTPMNPVQPAAGPPPSRPTATDSKPTAADSKPTAADSKPDSKPTAADSKPTATDAPQARVAAPSVRPAAPLEAASQPEAVPLNPTAGPPKATADEPAAAAPDRSSFCFIKNKALLRSEILPPDKSVATLIVDFDALGLQAQHLLLPNLSAVFRATANRPHSIQAEQFYGETRDWFERITHHTGGELRKVAIWLSRYCHNPETTLAEVQAVLNPAVAPPAAPDDEGEHNHDQPLASVERVTPGPDRPFAPEVRRRQIQAAEAAAAQQKMAASYRYLALMAVWMVLVFGLVVWRARAPVDTGAIAKYCSGTLSSPESCQLAVQMVGQDTLDEYRQDAVAFPVDKGFQVQHACQITGNLNAGVTIKDLHRNSYDALSMSGEEVLEGIYLAQMEQVNYKQDKEDDPAPGEDRVRTACVYSNSAEGLSPIAAEVIPLNWPKEPFVPDSWPMAIQRATRAYGTFAQFGARTLFTAIGLFMAAFTGLALKFRTMNGIILSAFILQTVEFILAFIIPFRFIFITVAKMVLALFITSKCVKQFEIDFSGGYRVVASGALVVIFLRFALDWGLFFLIVSLVR